MKKQKNNDNNYMNTLEDLLRFKYLDNSYKLLWFKSIVDYVAEGKEKITYREITLRMLSETWELVMIKNITFGRLDKVHRILEEIEAGWHIGEIEDKKKVFDLMKQIPSDQFKLLVEDLYEDTPYRFFEPLFEKQLKGKKDNQKNTILEELINTNDTLLYQMDSDKKAIHIQKGWSQWIRKNKKGIDSFLSDSMAYYLDKNASKRI